MKKFYLGTSKKCKFFSVLLVLLCNVAANVNAQSCSENNIGFGTTGTNTFARCVGTTFSVNVVNGGALTENSPGSLTYQWEVSFNGGGFGPLSPDPGSVASFTIDGSDYTVPGTYDFRRTAGGTFGASCDEASDVITLTINALPATPTITPNGPTTFCSGGSVDLTSSVSNDYLWTPGGATSRTINVTASGSYSVEVTDGNGCSATSASTVVTVNPLPATPTITPNGPTGFCAGGSVDLTSSVSGGYLWTPGGATTRTITVSTSGSYSVEITDGNGCTATSASQLVSVSPLPPTPTITPSGPTGFCAGGSVDLTSSVSGGYLWTPGGATTRTITVSTSGSYSVEITDGNGCKATSASQLVSVSPLPPTPTITPSGPTTFCAGGSVDLTSSVSGGYLWTPGGATSRTINVNASGSYSVEITDGNGCKSTSASTVVTVNPLPATPTITTGGPTTFCAGGSVNLTSSVSSGYLWTPGGATTRTISATASGSYSVEITDGNGCKATSASQVVTVNPLPATPTVTPSGPTTFCSGGSVDLTSSISGSYLWSPGGATTRTINVTTSGSYSVTITDGNGCSATSASTNVTVNPLPGTPTITPGGPTTFCAGGSVNLTSSVSSGYLWSPGGATTRTINVATSGSYSVQITDGNGCTATSASTVVTANPLPATPTITPSGPTTFCAGGSVDLTSSVSSGYLWSPGGATTRTINITASGSYSVTITDGNGCTATSASTVITVNPVPPSPTAGSNATGPAPGGICVGGTLNLTASNVAGATYAWTGPNGFTSPLQNPSIVGVTIAANGTYNVTATISGCTSSPAGQTVVLVKPNPPIPNPVGDNGPVCAGGTLNLTSTFFAGGTTVWSGPNGFTSTSTITGNASIANVTAAAGGTYTVTVTINGCTGPAGTALPNPVVINSLPSITVGTFPQVCRGVTTAALPYSAAVGGPNQYSIVYDPTAIGAGFANVTNQALPGSINLVVPAAAPAATYNGTLTVRNASCVSVDIPIQVTVKPSPSVNTVPNQTICMSGTSGATLNPINLVSVPAGATFTWTRTNPGGGAGFLPGTGINLPLAGSTSPITGVLTNTQGAGVTVQNTVPQTTVFTVTPALNGCFGAAVAVTSVTVNPRPNASFLEYSNDQNTYSSCTGGLVAGNSEDDIDVIQGFPGNGNGTWMYYGTGPGGPPTGPFNPAPLPGNNSVNQYVFGTSTIRTTVGNHYFFYQSNIGGCITRSDTIALTIYLSNNAPAVTQPAAVCGSSGAVNLVPFVTSCGANTQLKWYDADYTAPGGGTLLATGAFAPNPAVTTTYYVACINTSTNCESFRTAITITRNNATAGSIAGDQTLCTPFDPALLTEVTAGTATGTLTYQWQSAPGSCAGTFNNIAGATGATYDPPVIGGTTAYRRVTISTQGASVCTANSNCVTMSFNNVNPGSVGFGAPVPAATNCSGYNPVIFTSVAATGGGPITYQWQSSTTDNGTCSVGFTDINDIANGSNAAAYNAPPLTVTTYYRRVAISTIAGVPCTAISNCLTIVIANQTPGVIGVDQSVCAGGDPALINEVTASTGTPPLTYQWQTTTTAGCSTGFSVIASATGNTYDPPVLAGPGPTYFRRVTRSNGVCPVFSNCIAITTLPNPVGGTLASPAAACGGVNGTLNLTGSTGTVDHWESSTDGGGTWLPIGNAGNLAYTYNVTQPTQYRVIISSPTCGNATSTVASVNLSGYWTGATSVDWNTVGNWASGTIPDGSCDVYIPGTAARQPLLSNTPTGTVPNIYLLSGSYLTVNGTGTLQIKGAIINTGGTFDATAGRVEFNGTAASQTIAAGAFLSNSIKDLVISNTTGGGVSLGGPLNVFHSLTYGAGGTVFATNDNLTLKSNSTGTAYLGDMTGHSITGAVMVERYIPARKAWRFLTAPVSGPTIHASWQENQAPNALTPAGFGIQMTSDLGAINGYDLASMFPSFKTYSSATDTYIGVPSTNVGFNPSLGGYMTFIRGDRTANAVASPVTATTLRAKGTLTTGTQPAIGLSAVVTPHVNPYAAPLDLRKLSTSFNVHYYVWDPNRGGLYGFGAFQNLEWNGTSYDAIPGGSSSYPGNTGNFIESGQAFFISGTGSVTIQENTKGPGSGATVFRPASPSSSPDEKLRSTLYAVSTDGTNYLADGTLNIFGDYSNDVDGMDARKMANFGENLSIKKPGNLLVIERKQTITQQDTIFFNMTGVRAQKYQFQFEANNLNTGIEGFLEDNYLQSRTAINLSGTTTVDFDISDAASMASDRFRIVFKPSVVLPVTFTSVKGYRKDDNINVDWKVENEKGIKQYEVEKSINGTQFTTLAIIRATANNGLPATYSTTDIKPVEGYNYYRIKSVDINGKITYTNIVKVLLGSLKHDIVINPNPIRDGVIHLQFMNQPEGKYGIRLMNKLGQVIVSKQIERPDGSGTELIKWNFNVSHGVYQLEVVRPDGSKKNISVLY